MVISTDTSPPMDPQLETSEQKPSKTAILIVHTFVKSLFYGCTPILKDIFFLSIEVKRDSAF